MAQAKKAKHGKKAKLDRPGPDSSDSEEERPSPAALPPAGAARAAEGRGRIDIDERTNGGGGGDGRDWRGQASDRDGRGGGEGGGKRRAGWDGAAERRSRGERPADGGGRGDDRVRSRGGTPRFATAKTAIGTGAEGVEMSGGSAAGAGHPVGDRCRAYKPELVAIGAGYLPSSDKHSSIHGASSQYII